MTEPDSTQRFTDRVENYVRYRPSYPREVIAYLGHAADLSPDSVVADVGSGTGILTQLFLDNGNTVYAVEPNDAMREAAESFLGDIAGFHSVNGTAEATTLPDDSVDLVTAGQAFHWFDSVASRDEFARILRPHGNVALIWNMRRYNDPGFMADYEAMLRDYGQSYDEVKQSSRMSEIHTLYGEGFVEKTFPNEQVFDFAGLTGRLMSSSYAPQPGDPRHEPMIAHLLALFTRYEQDGVVAVKYDTQVFVGRPMAS